MRTLVWFRGKDLRVSDHAPLRSAIAQGEVIPLFVVDPYFFAPLRARKLPHRMQFLLESLEALRQSIAHLGSELLIAEGKSVEVVPRLAKQWKVDRVVAHRWSEPFGRERDDCVSRALAVPFELFAGETIGRSEELRTGSGTPFSVFTPFSRAWRKLGMDTRPLSKPRVIPPLPRGITRPGGQIPTLDALGVAKNPRLIVGGERAAHQRLRAFLAGHAADYPIERDRMDHPGTSRLSADLKFGTISAKAVWHAAEAALATDHPRSLLSFTNELLWREFTHHLLWERPQLLHTPFRPAFRDFPWEDDERTWRAWVSGTTGYPVVDAASRQLLGEGFVHNRARMISASFLTKHLLTSYQKGEAHYMEWLVDGDWAQNNAGWQWSAGCGCDAQPYFRVFNPVIQGKRFDPEGDYVRAWVPELGRLPARYIHAPWEAPPLVLKSSGVSLDGNYPRPIIDHRHARDRFLALAAEHLAANS